VGGVQRNPPILSPDYRMVGSAKLHPPYMLPNFLILAISGTKMADKF